MFRSRSVFQGLFVGLGLWLVAGVLVPTSPGFAHPTDRELRDAAENRRQCETEALPADRVDPIRLGMSEAELRKAVEGLRRDPPPDDGDRRHDQGLIRFVRDGTGDLAGFEYELWQDRVYRIRWRLAASFERPVLDEFVRRGRICFGAPEYDQTFEAEPGSPRATLRRIEWTHGDRRIELRQLHPLRGGAVYLSVTNHATLREIAAAGLVAFSPPDRSMSWWRRVTPPLTPATDVEKNELGRAFVALLSQLDH